VILDFILDIFFGIGYLPKPEIASLEISQNEKKHE
jgi:hypothetical protein